MSDYWARLPAFYSLSLSQEENYFFSNLLEVHVLSHQHSIVHQIMMSQRNTFGMSSCSLQN